MAATILTATGVPHTGLNLTDSLVAPTQTTGHKAPTGEGLDLVVSNSSGGVDVFIHVPVTVDGLAVTTPAGGSSPSRKFTIAAGKMHVLPLPREVYGDSSDSYQATFDLSTFANTTIGCIAKG